MEYYVLLKLPALCEGVCWRAVVWNELICNLVSKIYIIIIINYYYCMLLEHKLSLSPSKVHRAKLQRSASYKIKLPYMIVRWDWKIPPNTPRHAIKLFVCIIMVFKSPCCSTALCCGVSVLVLEACALFLGWRDKWGFLNVSTPTLPFNWVKGTSGVGGFLQKAWLIFRPLVTCSWGR